MKFYKLTPEYERIKHELARIGVDSYALNMVKKGVSLNILVRDIKPPAANILKQESIASGMDAAVKRGAVSCSIDKTDVLLMGNAATFERLIKRLSVQVFGLKELAKELKTFLHSKEIKYITYNNGKIDLLIINRDNTCLIIDYKTDEKGGHSLSELEAHLIKKYTPQLEIYKSAINKCFNIPLDNISCEFYHMYMDEKPVTA